MEYGSVEAAARSISMPAEHARELIELMNGSSRYALVESAEIQDGHVRLTEEGNRSLQSFWKLYEEFKLSLCLNMRKHGGGLSATKCLDK